MAAVVLLIISLLCSFDVQGSKVKFVKSGSDLILDVEETVELSDKVDFFWKRNSKKVLKLSYGKEPLYYDENAELFVKLLKNYSLLLKNVQPHNSENYTAVFSEQNDKVVAKYTVIVQDPVSPVSLLVTTSSFNSSCNIIVICRTNDSQIRQTFTCNKTCSPASEASLEKTHSSSSLDVYLEQDYVICNHSNHVSSSQNKTKITFHCEPITVLNTAIIIGTSSGVLLICLLCAVFIIIKKCKRKSSPEQTVYEVPQNDHQTSNEYDSPAEVTSDLPTSTYALVQFHTRPGQQVETPNTSQIETVYSQVNRATKSKSAAPTANH